MKKNNIINGIRNLLHGCSNIKNKGSRKGVGEISL